MRSILLIMPLALVCCMATVSYADLAPACAPAVLACAPPTCAPMPHIPAPPSACAPASCAAEHPLREGTHRLAARVKKFGGRVLKAATAPARWLFGHRE